MYNEKNITTIKEGGFQMNIKTKKPSVNLWLFFSSFHCSFILPERMQKIR